MVTLRCVSLLVMFLFLMIRRPPRSTPLYSSAASDVYKRQSAFQSVFLSILVSLPFAIFGVWFAKDLLSLMGGDPWVCLLYTSPSPRASQDLVCRLLLEKKKITNSI